MQDLTPRRFTLTVPPEQAALRLDAIVLEWLSRELATPLSKAAVRKLIMAGTVRLDGRPTRRPGALLAAGSRLEARVDVASVRGLADAAQPPSEDNGGIPLTVLYEDDALIAVAKPPGLPVHATADARRRDLFSLVRRLLSQRPRASAASDMSPYLGLHHRLDADTSGVVVFTKREAANAGLARQFAEGTVEKIYHAISAKPRGRAERTWRVENRLAPTGGGRRARMAAVQDGGVLAVTTFRLVRDGRAALLIEARPKTGRKHQIRAHLAGGGMPILGDVRYGGTTRVASCTIPRTMLHACRLTLTHPVTGAPLSIASPYPADFADAVACLFDCHPATISGR